MNTKPQVRFLHTSDVHLGAYEDGRSEYGRERHETVLETFSRVIDLGLRELVDFMVIAGDFFDHARVREETLHFASEQIARLGVPVVLAPGNHDHVGPNSVYDRVDLTHTAQNLRILRSPLGETIPLDRLSVAIWGRGHTEQDPDFAPLIGVSSRGDAAWHIGVAHGHYLRSLNPPHGSYPIRTEDIAGHDFDYLALGHWEQQTRVDAGNMVAAYSGAPEGLAGIERRRALIVNLEASGTVRLESHSLDNDPVIAHDQIPLVQSPSRCD